MLLIFLQSFSHTPRQSVQSTHVDPADPISDNGVAELERAKPMRKLFMLETHFYDEAASCFFSELSIVECCPNLEAKSISASIIQYIRGLEMPCA